VTLYRIPDRTLPKARTLSKKFENSDARIQQ